MESYFPLANIELECVIQSLLSNLKVHKLLLKLNFHCNLSNLRPASNTSGKAAHGIALQRSGDGDGLDSDYDVWGIGYEL